MAFLLASTSDGPIFVDTFDRSTLGSDYSVIAGGANWAVANSRIEHTPSVDNERVVIAAMEPRGSMRVQTMISRAGAASTVYPGLLLRWDESADRGYLVLFNDNSVQLYRRTPGTYTLLSNAGGGIGGRVTAWVADGVQKVWLGNTLVINQADAALNGTVGRAGLRTGRNGAGTAIYDDLVVSPSTLVSVGGLPTGYKLRVSDIGGATLSGPVTEVGGTASVDALGLAAPLPRLQVLDASNQIKDELLLSASPGEVYTWEVPNSPSTGTAGWWGRFWNRTDSTVTTLDSSLPPNLTGYWSVLDFVEFTPAGQYYSWNARFEGTIVPDFTETYTFRLHLNDGARIWIDGVLRGNWWDLINNEVRSFSLPLVAGQPYAVVVEYFQSGALLQPGVVGQQLRMTWESARQPRVLVPTGAVAPSNTAPVAAFSWSPASPQAGQTVQFLNFSYDPDCV